MAAALATLAYAAGGIYVAVIRPLRKARRKRHRPLYEIKDGKIYPA